MKPIILHTKKEKISQSVKNKSNRQTFHPLLPLLWPERHQQQALQRGLSIIYGHTRSTQIEGTFKFGLGGPGTVHKLRVLFSACMGCYQDPVAQPAQH